MNDCVPRRSTSSVSGPSESHFEVSFADFTFSLASALIARSTFPVVTSAAGYARSALPWSSPSPSRCSARSRSRNDSCANRPAFAHADGDSPSRDEFRTSGTAARAPTTKTTAAIRGIDLRMQENPSGIEVQQLCPRSNQTSTRAHAKKRCGFSISSSSICACVTPASSSAGRIVVGTCSQSATRVRAVSKRGGGRRGRRKAPPPRVVQGGNQSSIDRVDRCAPRPRRQSWRERRFGAHLDKARSSKHLRRRGSVAGHATIKWSGRFDLKERTEGLRREPLTPSRRRDPVSDLPFSRHREAPYRPHKFPPVVDRLQRV